ncbi:MAG TPA: hypothetical protein VD813_16350, partial [Pseudonocardia sp.]|nr:hypothetical protein [Pseudonocardia sp.]
TAVAGLAAQSERLHREVAEMQSATALAQRAAELGMVPSGNPARLVVGEDGTVTVVGEPSPVVAPAPPAPPPDPAAAPGTAADPATDPAAGDPAGPAADPAADPAAVQEPGGLAPADTAAAPAEGTG